MNLATRKRLAAPVYWLGWRVPDVGESGGWAAAEEAEGLSAQLFHGDCLEVMAGLPDASVDMILCDLPYGTTACKWDTVIPFEPLWAQYRRVAKRNAAIVLTASQPFTAALVMSNPGEFRYCWVWNKAKAANFPQVKRAPLKIHEDVVVFGGGYRPQMVEGAFRQKGGYSVTREAAVSAGAPAKHNNLYYPKSILDFSVAGNADSPDGIPDPHLHPRGRDGTG
jgi:site-specific DNA-methyltransferase (adenine-specific)